MVIGGESTPSTDAEFAVRATFDGWRGGVAPLHHDVRLPERQECVPAGVLAGALGVSEAFQFVRGDNAVAGRRDVGLSLWQPDKTVNWLEAGELGPPLERLPASAWIIGLGHLGQAFLWTLGLLPYASPGEVSLVLQDFDELVEANDSTSLLTARVRFLGEKKTRAMAAWCESRGFRSFHSGADDSQATLGSRETNHVLPCVALTMLLPGQTSKMSGSTASLKLVSVPAPRNTSHFRPTRSRRAVPRNIVGGHKDTGPMRISVADNPAYRALAESGLDDCGITTLAGRTVGASFVGAVTAAVVIAELIRLGLGGPRYEVVDGSLRSLELRQAVVCRNGAPFNPGTTRCDVVDSPIARPW